MQRRGDNTIKQNFYYRLLGGYRGVSMALVCHAGSTIGIDGAEMTYSDMPLSGVVRQ